MLNAPAPVNNLSIPDISHLTGDWLTVARMHISILTWDEADEIDRQMSASGLRSLLKNYEPGKPFTGIRLLNNRRGVKPVVDEPLPEGMLTVEQVAVLTGLHKKTIQRYCNIGWWKAVKRKRRLYIYPQEFKTQYKQPEPTPEADGEGRSVMTLKEAADRAGISYHCAARWFRKGKCPEL